VTRTHLSFTGWRSSLEGCFHWCYPAAKANARPIALSFRCHYQSGRKTGPFEKFVTDAQ